MNVTQTAVNGVVNKETLFYFKQKEHVVHAKYSGGKIAKGFLVGSLTGSTLKFSYCQLQFDGELDNGSSVGELSMLENGKIRMTENFEWGSRPNAKGVNIFDEI
ncbi:n-acetylglutamate synthase [Muricauda sp. JGD-17]|uniref:N-acetylglutamate synthase n=1 Tax=Flagellimonas ochracea TaxID=2696472 RepID=A0A964TDY0_9FLAO|nr:n-acetylglutamate synthase [Allomuricauda ochracea]NAY93165.1 n-acetylglutamate synthase [Allomuricauda ochracea]